jgi:hypothetical protein
MYHSSNIIIEYTYEGKEQEKIKKEIEFTYEGHHTEEYAIIEEFYNIIPFNRLHELEMFKIINTGKEYSVTPENYGQPWYNLLLMVMSERELSHLERELINVYRHYINDKKNYHASLEEKNKNVNE